MTVQVDHDAITNRGYLQRGTRYVHIDADGTRFGFSTFVQRPAAMRGCQLGGWGVYDLREREVIVEPNLERLAARAQDDLDRAEREASEARERLQMLAQLGREKETA